MSSIPLPLALFALAVGAAPLAGQQQLDRRMAADPGVSVRIVNLAGRTRVTGWDRDTVAVRGTIPRGGGSFYMGGGRQGIKVGVEGPTEGETPGSVLEVLVPRHARVWVKSATADVAIEQVTGEIDVYSVTGAVTISGTPVLVTAESMEGNIEVRARSSVTRVKSAGGDITLYGPGGDVTASSVSGTVRLVDAQDLKNGHIESVSGGVLFRGGLAKGGVLDLQTHDAPIELSLAPGQGAVLDVSAFGGTVRNLVPGMTAEVKGKTARYTVGDESARVSVRSLKGDVLLRRRMPRPNLQP